MVSKRAQILILIGSIIISIGLGVIIGYFSRKTNNNNNNNNGNEEYYSSLIKDIDPSFKDKLIQEMNVENMKKHLKYLTSIPHMGGTPGDKISADYVYNLWKEQNLDAVEMHDYDVYLSFPSEEKFNDVKIYDSDNNLVANYSIEEPTYDKDLNYTGIPKPFLAYGLGGSVKSDELYYANYGTEEDFLELQKQGYDITGKIVICRYGRIFRGNKITFAEAFGAKGVLLYDDPIRAAPIGFEDQVYPNGPWLPEYGVQRGSVFVQNGEPLTPEDRS